MIHNPLRLGMKWDINDLVKIKIEDQFITHEKAGYNSLASICHPLYDISVVLSKIACLIIIIDITITLYTYF